MYGAERDKVILFPAKITQKKVIDNFPFVFSGKLQQQKKGNR